MKLALLLLVACVQPVPPTPPTPPAPATDPCSAASMPPLVRSWLSRTPLTDPNSDELTLLVSWAKTSCTP